VGLVNDHRVGAFGKLADLLGHKRELLQRGDDDGGAAFQRLRELAGILIDRLNDARLVLKLVNGVLKLPVEHPAVGDDDHAVENFAVRAVMDACKTVGEPGDGVALAAAGAVLDQVIASRAAAAHVVGELSHRVKLVIAREYHCLRNDPAVFLFHLKVEKPRQDVDPAVAGKDILPQVGGFIPVRVDGISRGVAVAFVEREEVRRLFRKPCGHPHFVGVKAKWTSARFLNGTGGPPGHVWRYWARACGNDMAGEPGLDLGGGHWKAVDEKAEVKRIIRPLHAVPYTWRTTVSALRPRSLTASGFFDVWGMENIMSKWTPGPQSRGEAHGACRACRGFCRGI
jgi:hypothetical protein